MKVISCKRSSISAEKLAEALGVEMVVLPRGEFPEWDGTKYINYGCSWINHQDIILNNGPALKLVRNKLAFFGLLPMEFVDPAVPYTTEKSVAEVWNKTQDVFIRQQKLGCNGDGLIHVPEGHGSFPEGKFYTKRVHGREYRAYFHKKALLGVYEKQPKTTYPVTNWKFILKKEYEVPGIPNRMCFSEVLPEFIAIDYIADTDGSCHILEGNTAPILFPSVIKKLVKVLGE